MYVLLPVSDSVDELDRWYLTKQWPEWERAIDGDEVRFVVLLVPFELFSRLRKTSSECRLTNFRSGWGCRGTSTVDDLLLRDEPTDGISAGAEIVLYFLATRVSDAERSTLDLVLGIVFVSFDSPCGDPDSTGSRMNLNGENSRTSFRCCWAMTSYSFVRYSSTVNWMASLKVGTTSWSNAGSLSGLWNALT